jgi:hypothetical protein
MWKHLAVSRIAEYETVFRVVEGEALPMLSIASTAAAGLAASVVGLPC